MPNRDVDDASWSEQAELVLNATARILAARGESAANHAIGLVYGAAERHLLEAIVLMNAADELERDVYLGGAELDAARRERGR